MFNGVTLMPNMVAFQALYPWSWTSNYGNQTQFNVQNLDVPPQTAYFAQNCMSPSFWADYNLGITSQPFMPFNINDAKNQQALEMAYNQGQALGESLKFKGNIELTAKDIKSFNSDVNGVLEKKDLPADKKQKLETIKKKIETAMKRLEALHKKSQGMVTDEMKQELESIKGEIIGLKEVAAKLVEGLSETTGTGSTTGTGDATGGTTGGATGTTGGTGGTTGAATGAGEGAEEVSADDEKQKLYQLNQICHMLDKAMDGMGTDYDGEQGMKTVLEALVGPDNVIELWNQWNKTYGKQGSYAADDNGFIETLMDECEGSQKEEIATLLIDAMEQRAIAKGIDVDTEVSAARTACKSNWIGWRNDDKICDAMIALYNKLNA